MAKIKLVDRPIQAKLAIYSAFNHPLKALNYRIYEEELKI